MTRESLGELETAVETFGYGSCFSSSRTFAPSATITSRKQRSRF